MNATPIHQQLGLIRHPFPPAPDAESYFYTTETERRLAEAIHCLTTRKGIVLLTGEVGMGKSTFVRRMLTVLEKEYRSCVSLVLNTFLQGDQLLAAVLRDFALIPGGTAQQSLERLNEHLIQCYLENTTCVLVIDDAQNLTLESLELLRLLTNLETGQEKLLQIMLCGQPELITNLEQPAIRQLASRIVEHLQLHALNRGELARYVDYRLTLSGAAGRIVIEPAALRTLYRRSQGNARRVHLILDRCLYGLLAKSSFSISAALVDRAAQEAGIRGTSSSGSRTFTVKHLTRLAKPALSVGAFGVLVFALGYAAYLVLPVTPQAQAHLFPSNNDKPPAGPFANTTSYAASATEPVIGCSWYETASSQATGKLLPQLISSINVEIIPQLYNRDDICILPGSPQSILWQGDMAPENFSLSHPHDDVRRAQARLQSLGYYSSQPDGLFGFRTRHALQEFQRHQGIPPTGVPNALTLMMLAGAALVQSEQAADPSIIDKWISSHDQPRF